MQSRDGAVAAAPAGDVPGVGGVAEHLADGVLAELAVAVAAGALGVQPGGERAIGFLSGGVALEQLAHERCALGIVDGELGGGVAVVSPREHSDEVSLSRLLVQPAAGPEGERDGVVLVEHLVDRLGEERGGVGRVLAHRLGDGDDADAEPLAQELLVAPGLDLAASEARGVEHEHHVEAALGRVGHQALKLGPRLGFAPAQPQTEFLTFGKW